ncbi:Gentisate 1,2-dioxygenase [Pseudonocardia sp. Ae406_Ps2]|uniref:cupin domain-containing protein n=1 Tax=unclassified Pseudonocardia TaxID=2619320 RepID=UPI00094B601D|nr:MULTISPECIES: cupin domain-containing protein [unclassified Pseudonocardia]OLL96972.1 Gentisate 1,2-dioxygenase [Pseudonocardia sp. Ae331_Ps2]OLM05316.1 Gentisate 1,2-dioxygenase [Pseudonocardia sp. Ae406_Ps2]OLM15733.1 Gentisate 1,2-dioxygenase [Pseudonocardia sp. Ae505_Ps2]OLM26888.1 Gentisate 1,2-dioxygenase [Pseudonocardia sp. Ae706_Ps2]OLM32990.1 Gentisate 1,2-dioxygenase [Pseudonocardia sp. Ae717_Ps2]
MSTRRFSHSDPELDELYSDLSTEHLQPLWELKGLLTPTPTVASVPHRWSAAQLRSLGERSGQLVGIDRGGDRRVLACANPGLGGAPYAVSSLWAAVQYLGPREVAPAHRHTPAALRFILEGSGVWTLVDGDPLAMSAGDLVLTPSWTFHEHHNPSDEPMLWMDVLDLPMVAALEAVFFEEGPSEDVERLTDPVSRSERSYGAPGLLPPPAERTTPTRHSPLLAYRWADTDRALARRLDVTGAGAATMTYVDPTTGRDVMPTMRCEAHRVVEGASSPRIRQTGSRVLTVFHGSGVAEVGEQRFDLGPGDILAIPSWVPWSLHAHERIDAFSTSDAPVLHALGLYREQEQP